MGAAEMPQHLPGVLCSLEPTLHFGYAAVVGLIFVEDFGVPVPGETVLILGAVYASTGRFNALVVGLLGLVGAVDVGFAIGPLGDRPLSTITIGTSSSPVSGLRKLQGSALDVVEGSSSLHGSLLVFARPTGSLPV
jgi:membrane protein DedA with SNARE-associated domain